MSLKIKIEEQAQTWLLRVMSNDLTEQEQLDFDQWYHQSQAHRLAYDKASDLWLKLDLVEEEFLSDSHSHHSTKPSAPTYAKQSKNVHNQSCLKQPWLKQAAIFLVCIAGLSYFYKNDILINFTADIITAQGQ